MKCRKIVVSFEQTIIAGLSGSERISTICLAVLTQYRSATDGERNGRNCHNNMARAFMNACTNASMCARNYLHE